MSETQIYEHCSAVFRAASPPARLSPSEWASNRVHIKDGLTPKFRIESTPWMREVIDQYAVAETKELVALCPVGTGKTTAFLEAGLSYVWCEDPGPTLIVGQTDDDLGDWAETRMAHCLNNTPECAILLPRDRHKKRKMEVIGAAMSLFLTGANISGLQSKSMRRVICDEPWLYKKGMLKEAEGRLHDRWNRQFMMLSQAGVKGDELDGRWNLTDKREFSFPCPSCGQWQPWKWCNVVYDEDENKTPLEQSQTARIKCENADCTWTCPDSPQPRRNIAESAKYIPTATGLPGHVGFHYNVLCNWRKPLWEIVLLWMEAKAAQRVGNLDPLRQFIQKRLAEPWEEDLTDNRTELVGNGYLLSEFSAGQKIDNEAFRFLTVDKQRDHFWALIRAWRADGSSRLIYFGRVETFDSIHDLATRYHVPAKMVFIDAQYDTDLVYSAAAPMDWTCLHGSGQKSFPFRKANGDIIQRPFARFAEASTTNGRRVRYAHWSSDRIKDILHAHRTGQAAPWEIPDDVPAEFIKQIDAETKREITNSKTRQVEFRWVKTRRDNHAFDIEAMQIVAALMVRIIPGFDV